MEWRWRGILLVVAAQRYEQLYGELAGRIDEAARRCREAA